MHSSDFDYIEFNGSRRNKSKYVSQDEESVSLQAANSDYLQMVDVELDCVTDSEDQSSHGFKEKASHQNSLKDCHNTFQSAGKNSENYSYDETPRRQASFTVMFNEMCTNSSVYSIIINNNVNNKINNCKNDNNNKNNYNDYNNNNTNKLLKMIINSNNDNNDNTNNNNSNNNINNNKIFLYVLVKQQRCNLVYWPRGNTCI